MKKDVLPRLLTLLKEQEMDTFRPSAKPPKNVEPNFDEHQDWSEDEMNRVRGDQTTVKRKAFSSAGLPVLAQQRFNNAKKQNQVAQNPSISQEGNEPNTVKKLLKRRCTTDFTNVMGNMSEAARERKTGMITTVNEEDWSHST